MKNNPLFEYLVEDNGHCPFEDFLHSLPDKDQAKLLTTIEKIEMNGLLTSMRMKWIKKLDNNLYEIRSKLGSNIQRAIYFQKVDNVYLITHGFTKKSQKTPVNEINRAKSLKETYERRVDS